MLMVSTPASPAKSVVAESVIPSTMERRSSDLTSEMYDLPSRDGLRPFRVDIKADGRQAGPGKLDREGQTDVAETDHACSCPFLPNPIEQRVSRHRVRRGQV